jgi:hypothetical protein
MRECGARRVGGGTVEVQGVRSRRRWRGRGGARAADGGGAVAVQAARGATQGGGGAVARRRQTVAARLRCKRRGRRTAARTGGTMRRGGGDDDEGEETANGEDERVKASGQESYMTGGPRRFSYRRLIRRLGFERRMITSV